jgi:hypothetical protein
MLPITQQFPLPTIHHTSVDISLCGDQKEHNTGRLITVMVPKMMTGSIFWPKTLALTNTISA